MSIKKRGTLTTYTITVTLKDAPKGTRGIKANGAAHGSSKTRHSTTQRIFFIAVSSLC